MDYIYSRVSTDSQSVDPQLAELTKMFPQARVVSEIASGAKARPMLMSLVTKLTKEDRLIVSSLDRLGRQALDLLQLMEYLEAKGVVVKSIREGVDYSTPVGKMVTQIIASVAEMERNLISERTKAGLKAARQKGRVGGRPETLSKDSKAQAIELEIGRAHV